MEPTGWRKSTGGASGVRRGSGPTTEPWSPADFFVLILPPCCCLFGAVWYSRPGDKQRQADQPGTHSVWDFNNTVWGSQMCADDTYLHLQHSPQSHVKVLVISGDALGPLELVCHEEVDGIGHFFAVKAGVKMALVGLCYSCT